jgi:exodeoxyribonuclease-3
MSKPIRWLPAPPHSTAKFGQGRAAVEGAGIEEVRAGAPGLQGELAESAMRCMRARGRGIGAGDRARRRLSGNQSALCRKRGIHWRRLGRQCASHPLGSPRLPAAFVPCASSASTPMASAPPPARDSFDWLAQQQADIVCLQETKAQEDQLIDPSFRPDGHQRFFAMPSQEGLQRRGDLQPARARRRPHCLGWAPFDEEGRYIEARFGNLSVVSFYLPSGSSGEERQGSSSRSWPGSRRSSTSGWRAAATTCCAATGTSCAAKRHQELDFEPEELGLPAGERAWLNGLIADAHGDGSPQPERGWRDSFRVVKPDAVEYTWWSNRGAARANDVGWRIDYQLATPALAERAHACVIHREPRFSDHAPYVVDYAG